MTEEGIGRAVIAAAMKVHSAVGPGLLESAYETCLPHLRAGKAAHQRAQARVSIPIRYDLELTIENGYRIDLLVGGLVVVELKAVPAILPVHRGQLLSYLELGGFKLGYLLNFNVAHMRDGVMRLVNGL